MNIEPGHAGGLLAAIVSLPLIALAVRLPGIRAGWAAATLTTRVAAVLLAVDGALHLGLVSGHAAGSPALATAFALQGVACLVLLAALPRLSWWRWPAGLVMLASLTGYWFYLGSGREAPDEVGMLSKLLELGVLGLSLVPHRAGGSVRRFLRTGAAAAGILVLTGCTGVLGDAVSLKSGGHRHEGAARAAGPGQVAAAQSLAARTATGISRFQDVRVALRDGYRPSTPDGSNTVHYANPRYNNPHYLLDPNHPQTLVYGRGSHGPMLLGAMYMMPKPGQAGPAPGGPLTVWHSHDNLCFSLAPLGIAGLQSGFGQCPFGTLNVNTPEMIHIWTVPSPDGPYHDLNPSWLKLYLEA